MEDHGGVLLLPAVVALISIVRLFYVLSRTGRPFRSGEVPRRASTLIILGSGGHTAEMLNLLAVLDKDRFAPRHYVAAVTDSMSLQGTATSISPFPPLVGGSLKLGMPITAAFRVVLDTWASWIETMVNANRTHVFFRTFEPSHWSDPHQKVCEVTQQPMVEAKGNDRSEFSDIIADVVSKMRVPVTVLNVTSMGAVRSDAHIGTWSDLQSLLDCSHWCLPGVPDAWNELVLYLLTKRGGSLS